jgi:quercetin dioxygenase-like cupin family protein
MMQRIFASSDFFLPSVGEPLRTVVCETVDAVVVAWYLQPGQEIARHIHPHGQDTWTILAGQGQYSLDLTGQTQRIQAGDVVVAPLGQVHGVVNDGEQPLQFISVVCPGEAGYELVQP